MNAFTSCLNEILTYKKKKNVPRTLWQKIVSLSCEHYKYYSLLGDGGESLVLHCIDEIVDREIALKIFLPHIDEKTIFIKNKSKQRCFRGFSIQQKLHRIVKKGIIPDILNYQYVENPWIAMEYIDGLPLMSYMEKNVSMPEPERLALFFRLAEFIDEIHYNAVIHRDIKPDNILVTKTGEIALIDWGMSKQPEQKANVITGLAERMGSPGYMPEELWDDAGSADYRTDIYLIAEVMYNIMTGKNCVNLGQKGKGIYDQALLPFELIQIFIKATQREMKDRYHTIKEMLKSVRDAYGMAEITETETKQLPIALNELKQIQMSPLAKAFVEAVSAAIELKE